MYYWFEERDEPYSDANKLANWQWEEVEDMSEEEDGLDENFTDLHDWDD